MAVDIKEKIEAANAKAYNRITVAEPVLADIVPSFVRKGIKSS